MTVEPPLAGRVALVAGATRGAGRGIAIELGAAGATVYATGRSTRSGPLNAKRPETIEETAELITAAGGAGIAVPTDHLESDQVAALVARIDAEQGRLDILVNDIFGGDSYSEWDTPVWQHDQDNGLRMLRLAIDTHLVTARRSEAMLDHFGVAEDTWRDACATVPHFAISESPRFVGRGIVALATDPDRARWNSRSTSSGELAKEYGLPDHAGSTC